MKTNKSFIIQKRLFFVQIILFIMSAVSIIFIPYAYSLEERMKNRVSYIIAGTFWICLLIGIILIFLISSITGTYKKMYDIEVGKKHIPGIFKFWSNMEAKVAIICFVIGFLLVISDVVFDYMNEICIMISFAFMLISFYIHCIFDGFNYRYYKILKKGMNKNES